MFSNLCLSWPFLFFLFFFFIIRSPPLFFFFFFNDTATTEIYTLSLHDALPISVYCSFSGGGIIGWMSPRIADTFSAADTGSARRRDYGANERRSIALFSLNSSLCPSRPRVSHLRLRNGSEAGAGGRMDGFATLELETTLKRGRYLRTFAWRT